MTPEQLRTIRARLNISRAELAKKLGVTRRTVESWETAEGHQNHRKMPQKAIIKVLAIHAREFRRYPL